MAEIYLSLGSNVGDRRENLAKALALLTGGVTIGRVSSYYETAPVDFLDQAPFLNIVLSAETGLSPEALLEFTQGIERQMKRTKTIRFGPRIIDIDILLYDEIVMDREQLTLPHPRMLDRAFVLVPLMEIAPDLTIGGRPVGAYPAARATSGIRLFDEKEAEQ